MLLAFILGFPANEIVMPIAIMAYMSGGVLTEITDLVFLKDYQLGDFVKLQYTINQKTVSVPCQFSSVTINRDNLDNTENPTLKEVK